MLSETLYLRTTATQLASDIDDTAVGTGGIQDMGGGQYQWVRSVGASSYKTEWQSSLGPIYPYKMRGYGLQKLVNEDLDNPLHPDDGWLAHAWGTQGSIANLDTYTKAVSMGPSSYSTYGHVMVADIDMDSNGIPIGGTGTTDLPHLTVTVGMSTTPDLACSGKVVVGTDLLFNCGGDDLAIDLSSLDTTVSGVRVTGGAGSLALAIVDYSAVPATGVSVSVVIYPPTAPQYDLQGYNWSVEYSGMEFSIRPRTVLEGLKQCPTDTPRPCTTTRRASTTRSGLGCGRLMST
jgi:hypothetical protein